MSILVKDNFLGDKSNIILDHITSPEFPYYYQNHLSNPGQFKGKELQAYNDPPEAFLFAHQFVRFRGVVCSAAFDLICKPIFEKVGIDLDNNVIIRASINFTPNVNKVIKSGWHRDQTYKSKVLIYYFNTNNGCTEFQKGEKIDSVQDRLITFDGVEDIHRSVSQTDTKMRLVLNVNYE